MSELADYAAVTGMLLLLTIGAVASLVALQISIMWLGHIPGMGLLLLPAQLVVSAVQSVLGGFLTVWATATYASLYGGRAYSPSPGTQQLQQS